MYTTDKCHSTRSKPISIKATKYIPQRKQKEIYSVNHAKELKAVMKLRSIKGKEFPE
jgi:hypothetical protein